MKRRVSEAEFVIEEVVVSSGDSIVREHTQ